MTDERDISTLYNFFGHVAHKLNNYKVDIIGINLSSGKL
jgi:hypothetical protein